MEVTPAPPESIVCSFCGLPQDPERPLVAGATRAIAICRPCVELCAEIFEEMGKVQPPRRS